MSLLVRSYIAATASLIDTRCSSSCVQGLAKVAIKYFINAYVNGTEMPTGNQALSCTPIIL
jgi:hypothetical protein